MGFLDKLSGGLGGLGLSHGGLGGLNLENLSSGKLGLLGLLTGDGIGRAGGQGLTPGMRGAPGGDGFADPAEADSAAEPAVAEKKGFLDRLKAPDRGMSFSDKLYAAGDIAMGNDPVEFIKGREAAHTSALEKAEKKARMQNMARALADSIDPVTGLPDPQKYAAATAAFGEGVDIDDYTKMAEARQPKLQAVNTPEGGYDIWNTRDPSGGVVRSVAGRRKLPTGLTYDDNGEPVMDQDLIDFETARARARAKATADYRAPPRARAGAKAAASGPPPPPGGNWRRVSP